MRVCLAFFFVLIAILVATCGSESERSNEPAGDNDAADDDQADNDVSDDDVDDDETDDDSADDDIDDDAADDDTIDDDAVDDDATDDDIADDDTVDDDSIDDDIADDDFIPPSPIYGYYDESNGGNWTWMESQLPVFAAHNLSLFLAMPDTSVGDPTLLQLLRAAEAQGVEVRAWIVLPYEVGYWPGESNAEIFAAAARAYAAWFVQENIAISWIVVDMEMNINTLYQINDLIAQGKYLEAAMAVLANYTPDRFAQAAQTYQQLVDDLFDLGFYTMVVTYPHVLEDMEDGDTFLQDVMEVPVSPVRWHEISTMVYTTTYEEFSGLHFGPYMVYDYARSTVETFGPRASIALGVSGQMTDAAELANEVAAAKAAGIERIQVYSYAGSFNQPNPEEWHQAFDAAAAIPPPEASTGLLRGLIRLVDKIFIESRR